MHSVGCQVLSPPVDPSSLILVQCGLPMISPFMVAAKFLISLIFVLWLLNYCRRWMFIRSGFITVVAWSAVCCRQPRREGPRWMYRCSAPLSLKVCYFGPLVTNILSFCLKIVVLTYLDKVFKTQSLWAEINMSHQPVDDVKGTMFASSDLVLDRIWWYIVAFPNIHHPGAVWEQLEEVEYMCHCGRT